MVINKKLIHFKNKQKFNEELANGNILETSIVFIQDTQEIYTHGIFYDGKQVDLSNIETSIQNILNNKQDNISDLEVIRNGAALGATAVQPNAIADMETKTNAAATYQPKGNYVVDDVVSDGVYAVAVDGSLIDYNSADATATGVALVAGEHKFMIAKSNATDGSNFTWYWTKSYSDLSLTNYNKADGTNSSGYLPKPDGTFSGSTHLSGDFTTWKAGALSDFNGKANIAIIAAASSHAKDMCTVLNTFNASDSFKDWYVPACGQLALMYLNMTEINAALAKIGGTALAAAYYRSSSEYSSSGAWSVAFHDGYVGNVGKDNNVRVRFVRDISVKPLKERVSEIESSVSELQFNVYTKEEIDEMLSISKYEFVDLGLPSGLKWATCNVGATKPEEFGLYFAWGETQGYADTTEKQFNWSDYKLCGGSDKTLTKYNKYSSYGTVDTLTTLEQVDDAAYTSDKTCRMPTKVDFEELTANTTSTWETLNGVNGRRFTSKTNGNSIFVPAAGYCDDGSVYDVGSSGYLWSSSLNESNSWDAQGLLFYSDDVYVSYGSRYDGLAVRAVQEANTNTKFNLSETVSKVNNLESQLGDINAALDYIINGPKLITFTIDSVECQAEEGMTWREWIFSKYYNKDISLCINPSDTGTIQEQLNSTSEAVHLVTGAGASYTPNIISNEVIINNQVYNVVAIEGQ